ncbi:MAG: RES family NAD+ phosphorylase [Thermomicrobiales bacterium]
MPPADDWDAARAVASCPVVGWEGRAWRMQRREYPATDASGSRKYSGRYNRGLDLFPEGETWTALYLATSAEICIGEILRHITPASLPLLNSYRISEIVVWLDSILDCRNADALGLEVVDLCHDTDFTIPHLLARETLSRGFGGMLVPSATLLGDNLIVFPKNVSDAASFNIVGERNPALYVPRP